MSVYKIGFESHSACENAFLALKKKLQNKDDYISIDSLIRSKIFTFARFPEVEIDNSFGWNHDDLKFITAQDLDNMTFDIYSTCYLILPEPHEINQRKSIQVRFNGFDKPTEYKDVKSWEIMSKERILLLHRDVGDHYILLDSIAEFLEV